MAGKKINQYSWYIVFTDPKHETSELNYEPEPWNYHICVHLQCLKWFHFNKPCIKNNKHKKTVTYTNRYHNSVQDMSQSQKIYGALHI